MGWDIVFCASFSATADPAARFRAVQEAFARRPGFVRLWSFEVLDDPFLGRPPVAKLDSDLQGATPVTDERVAALLARWSSADVAFRGVWETRAERDGAATMGTVMVSVFGARQRWRGNLPRPIDVTWDAGDSRRYTAAGRDGHPSVAQVMADLEVLVELGAESFWGTDADARLTPDNLYAVYHRDPNAYRHDGVRERFVPVAIDDNLVRFATQGRAACRTVETPGGPIVYHEALGEGRLGTFYAGLGGTLLAVAEEAAEADGADPRR